MGKNLSPFKVLEKIGLGGLGEVFLDQDTALNTQKHRVSHFHLSAYSEITGMINRSPLSALVIATI